MQPLVRTTERGLYCEAGGFFIDPWLPVDRAVITHGHTDHARWGHRHYLSTPTGAIVLNYRFGEGVAGKVQSLPYREKLRIGDVYVSFHPAGHVLGSGQVRIERATADGTVGETWVCSGDYKTQDDGISEPFEPVRCNTFITESTFGLPVYKWKPQSEQNADMNRWWKCNADEGVTSIIACYALGKAQRLMGGLDPSIGPILIHGALAKCTQAYRDAGVRLPETIHATQASCKAAGGRALVLAPPSAVRAAWAFNLVKQNDVKELATAMASGWMTLRGTRRRRALDRGFAVSDHVDWPGLMWAIEQTGAEQIGVTHGSVGTVVRYLKEKGKNAFGLTTRFVGEGAEEQEEEGVAPAAPMDTTSEETGDVPGAGEEEERP